MSEGDVSLIRDEDQLRNMWKQAEDFGRKKEIRAHMYRLREERLRNFHSDAGRGGGAAEDPGVMPVPAQHTDVKGCEFSKSSEHTKSFADQSFQSIKSKEVRDAGSPPRDYSYKFQDSKDNSNAGWIVEAENKTSDDGKTRTQVVQSEVSGKYKADGGDGQFYAVDQQKKAVTEHNDKNVSFKKSESSSATTANEHFVKQSDDGTAFSRSAATSSTHQSVSSRQMFASDDNVDFASDQNIQKDVLHSANTNQTNDSVHSKSNSITNKSTNVVRDSQLTNIIQANDQGELTFRKVEYPDENTKVIKETRTLADGTTITSTKYEMRGPQFNTSSHSERHTRNETRSENNTSKSSTYSDQKTTGEHRDIREKIKSNDSREDIKTELQKENLISDVSVTRDCKSVVSKTDKAKDTQSGFVYKNNEAKNTHSDVTQYHKTVDNFYDDKIKSVEETIEKQETATKEVKGSVEETAIKKSESYQQQSQYTTHSQSEYSQKRISKELSPTHQVWASSLRADSPPKGSPYTKNDRSSNSSLRSSISPEKFSSNRPKSRPSSPNKVDRMFSARSVSPDKIYGNVTQKTERDHLYSHKTDTKNRNQGNTRFLSPERKPIALKTRSPSPPGDNILKDTSITPKCNKDTSINFAKSAIEDSLKVSKYDSETFIISEKTDSEARTATNVAMHESPEKKPKHRNESPEISTTRELPKHKSEKILISETTDYTKTREDRGTRYISPERKPRIEATHSPSPNVTQKSTQGTSTNIKNMSDGLATVDSTYRDSTSPDKATPIRVLSPTRKSPKGSEHPRQKTPEKSVNFSSEDIHNKKTIKSSQTTQSMQTNLVNSDGKTTTTEIYPNLSSHSPTRDSQPKTESSRKSRVVSETKTQTDVTHKNIKGGSPSPIRTSPSRNVPDKYETYSKDKYKDISTTNFVSTEKKNDKDNRILICDSSKSNIRNSRILQSPATSPTRSGRSKDSSPTTSVSDIMYFSSPQDTNRQVTDLDDDDTVDYKQSEQTFIVTEHQSRPKSIPIGKEPTQSKVSSPTKGLQLVRKSSLKKTTSKDTATSPVDRPSSTFKILLDNEENSIHHKVIKKDKPEGEEPVKKVLKERPPFTRTETYEERCRKILMPDKKTLVAEKTLSEILNILPQNTEKSADSESSSISISPYSSPERELRKVLSPLKKHSINENKAKETLLEFIYKEKTTEECNHTDDVNYKQTVKVNKSLYSGPTSLGLTEPNKYSIVSSRKTSDSDHQSRSVLKNTDFIETTTKRALSPVKKEATSTKQLNRVSKDNQIPEKSKTTKISEKSKPTQTPVNKDSPENNSSKTALPSKSIPRSVSPKKSKTRSVSPVKRPQSLNRETVDKKTSLKMTNQKFNTSLDSKITTQKIITKKGSLTEFPSQKNRLFDNKKDLATSNQTSHKSNSQSTASATKLSDLDKSQIRRRPLTSESSRTKITHSNIESKKENVIPLLDQKITRTTSDISIKANKSIPVRMKSKPEINVTTSTNRLFTKQTKASAIKTNKISTNKLDTKMDKSTLTTKPKSETTLNHRSDDDIIIDIQQAKSSRENSPDRICPTPINFMEDTGKPRLPDEVSEPEDESHTKRFNKTIHETESLFESNIVELSDEEEFEISTRNKEVSQVDRVSGSDECLLSVNDKVSKFLNASEAVTGKIPVNTTTKTYLLKKDHTDIDKELITDECLLSVSEKVSKFAITSPATTSTNTNYTNEFLKNERNVLTHDAYEDNYCKLSVNDKASLFVKTAEEIATPIKLLTSVPKVTLNVIKNVNDAQGSQKVPAVNRQETDVRLEEDNLIGEETLETTGGKSKMVRNEIKNKYENLRSESYTKDTFSSHAKIREGTPHAKSAPTEKPSSTSSVKVTTMRSNEAVKKAKALFENISSVQINENISDTTQHKGTKLTDIGVYKKPEKHNITVVDIEIKDSSDISPITRNVKKTVKNSLDSIGTHTTQMEKKLAQITHPTSPVVSDQTKETEEKQSKKYTEKTINKSVLSRYPLSQNSSPLEIKKAPPMIPAVEKIQEVHDVRKRKDSQEAREVQEVREVSSRHGSGKFGVELRRTSVEVSTPERRTSSVGEPHIQPCIEEIFDAELLEQMLEKIDGYEQRRRIRAQIRVAKKYQETQNTSSRTHTTKTHAHLRNTSQDRNKKSPEHRPTKQAEPVPTIKQNTAVETLTEERVTRRSSLEKKVKNNEYGQRSPSPAKRPEYSLGSPARSPTRRLSLEKKVKNKSPTRPVVNGMEKGKSNKISEYATAYMKKVGLESPLNETLSVETKKEIAETKSKQIIDSKKYATYTKHTSSMESHTERRSSKDHVVEVIEHNDRRTPSPEGKKYRKIHSDSPKEHVYQRSPSPDLKRPRQDAAVVKGKPTSAKIVNVDKKNVKTNGDMVEDKPSWVTNNGLRKTILSETRSFTNKKVSVTDKPKYRSTSPSKVITKPTDVITSSYGLGPMGEDGRPLFGIKALRQQKSSQNYEVTGTVIRKEFHSENGGEPEGEISVTAYSSNPEHLTNLLDEQEMNGDKSPSEIRKALQERQQSRIHGLSSITTTKKFGGTSGNSISRIHKNTEQKAIEQSSKEKKSAVRQNSVKCLTEKFIKNAVDTSKAEKVSYPKAGLILRSSSNKDNVSTATEQQDSDGSIDMDRQQKQRTHIQTRTHTKTRTHTPSHTQTKTVTHTHTRGSGTGAGAGASFLDSGTKVTGVQDILARMKNADIVIKEGDTLEESEARALLNKFLGATVLMAGMESYVTDNKGGGGGARVQARQETKLSRTVTTKSAVSSEDLENCWDQRLLRQLLEECTEYEQRRDIRSRLKRVMAEQEACAQVVADAAVEDDADGERSDNEETVTTKSTVTKTESKEETVSSINITDVTPSSPKPVSPFAKFQQLEKQTSTSNPSSPVSPGAAASAQPMFRFTDPALQASAVNIKERLLQWCRDKTKDYENVKLDNFSTSWSDGMAFCALIHHFLPEAFDYSQLLPKNRRHNFTLAFKVADEKAGIYPLLDVDDMVSMRKPDWKCVFTYVQAIHRRFKDQL